MLAIKPSPADGDRLITTQKSYASIFKTFYTFNEMLIKDTV